MRRRTMAAMLAGVVAFGCGDDAEDKTPFEPGLDRAEVAGVYDIGRLTFDPDGTLLSEIDVAGRLDPAITPYFLVALDGTDSTDVTINGNSGIFVRGFGINAEFDGSVRLAGTTGNPVAVGAFPMQRGRIEVIGRRFELTHGRLTFSGNLIPVVDFAAVTSTSEATVTVNVTGPANDPEITFTSSPSLPEEEILSRLLFDRGIGRLSALQAAQLVDAVAQLSGVVGRGQGLFDRVRQATGLDDLDIRQDESGGTTVDIGRQINDNLRLGVEGGSSGGRVTIDLDITRNLKAQAEAGQDGSGKVGITFEHEY